MQTPLSPEQAPHAQLAVQLCVPPPRVPVQARLVPGAHSPASAEQTSHVQLEVQPCVPSPHAPVRARASPAAHSPERIGHALPATVGSPLSINALREDLDVAFETVRAWIGIFERLHATFRVPALNRAGSGR